MALATGFGLLALFSLINLLLGNEDGRASSDPRDAADLWMLFGRR